MDRHKFCSATQKEHQRISNREGSDQSVNDVHTLHFHLHVLLCPDFLYIERKGSGQMARSSNGTQIYYIGNWIWRT